MLSRDGRARGRNEEEKERDKVASEQAAQGRRGEERDDVTRDVKGTADVQMIREEDEKSEEREGGGGLGRPDNDQKEHADTQEGEEARTRRGRTRRGRTGRMDGKK